MEKAFIALAALLSTVIAFANDVAEIKAKVEKDHKVVAVDKFHGFDRVVFDFDGYEAWVVCPVGETRKGMPWTWCMQWATAFVPRTNVPQMLRDGYHHVTINTFKHRMDATGLKVSAAFQDYLVGKLGFAKKAYLIGMSWGGFFSIRYANRYPGNVAKIYMDAPLLCFQDSRLGIGPWEGKMPADGWVASPDMPRNMAESIARADVPLLVLYGGMDTTCPPDYNCEPFMERFRAAGGDLTVVKRGLYAHHPHGVEESDDSIKRFFERPKTLPVADYPGEAGAANGWKSVESKEGEMVCVPFGGTFPSKGGRIESPKFKLDKTADENAWYRLTFQAKGEVDGYWWVNMEDADGKGMPDVNSRLYASADWQVYSVLVPTRPEAVTASIAFGVKETVAVRDVRMKRISAAEAVEMVKQDYAAGPQLKPEVTAADWTKLPNTRVAIKVAKDFRIVFLGDSIMNDTWCGGFNALLAMEYPDTVFRSYLSVRGSTGCWYYHEPAHFEEYVMKFKPNLVVIGGCSNFQEEHMTLKEAEDWMVETIERCKAIGAEVVVCTPPKSREFRTDPSAKPFVAKEDDQWFRCDYLRRAADRAGVQLWDMTTGPCGAVAESGKPLGWFNRDKVHNDNRGKVLNAMMMFRYFNAAQK